jgi:hypothetical protein
VTISKQIVTVAAVNGLRNKGVAVIGSGMAVRGGTSGSPSDLNITLQFPAAAIYPTGYIAHCVR